MITIRHETPADHAAIREVNLAAFGQAIEADLVDRLRATAEDFVSLVAIDDGAVVGHIAFSRVVVGDGASLVGSGLGPMAVLPERQRGGVGTQLVHAGLAMLRERGCPFVVVVGHPEYYPRFGFQPASGFGIRCQWDGIPDEVFMVWVLDATRMAGVTGVARYQQAFSEFT